MWNVLLKFPVMKKFESGVDWMLNLSKMHSFSYKSHNFDFSGSNTCTVATGLLVIATSQILTVKKSLENMYLPFLLKQASLIDVTISVKKFFLEGSSASARVMAVLSQMPD